jgi:hypothetical protein
MSIPDIDPAVFNYICCMLSLYTCMHTHICMPSRMYRIGAHMFERVIYMHVHVYIYEYI